MSVQSRYAFYSLMVEDAMILELVQFEGGKDYLITVAGLKQTRMNRMEGCSKASACLLCILFKQEHLFSSFLPLPTLKTFEGEKSNRGCDITNRIRRMKARQLHETRACSTSPFTIVLPVGKKFG